MTTTATPAARYAESLVTWDRLRAEALDQTPTQRIETSEALRYLIEWVGGLDVDDTPGLGPLPITVRRLVLDLCDDLEAIDLDPQRRTR